MRKDTASARPSAPALPHPPRPNGPRTVVFLDHTASLGGGEIALLNLVQALDRSRTTPVVVLGEDGPLAARLREASVELYVLPLDAAVSHTRKDSLSGAKGVRAEQLMSSLRYVARLWRLLRERRPDIVHTNSLKADVLGGVAARLAGVPIVWHVRDRIAEDYLPSRAVRAFRALCCVVPHAIAVNSRATLETLQIPPRFHVSMVSSGIGVSRVHVVHDGFVADDVAPATASHPGPVIGLVGRISPWKGQDVFLRAAALVRREFPSARFQVIGSALFGEAEYEAQIRALASELELDSCVDFLGFRTDVPRLLAEMDILVHASTTPEPFGQVVMEGMAAGKPVVATSAGGVLEIVAEGETGLLVPLGDHAAMAEAIAWLLRHPERARAMGAAGRRRVGEKFTIAQTAAKVEALYRVLEGARHGRQRTGALAVAAAILIWALRRRF